MDTAVIDLNTGNIIIAGITLNNDFKRLKMDINSSRIETEKMGDDIISFIAYFCEHRTRFCIKKDVPNCIQITPLDLPKVAMETQYGMAGFDKGVSDHRCKMAKEFIENVFHGTEFPWGVIEINMVVNRIWVLHPYYDGILIKYNNNGSLHGPELFRYKG